MPSANFHILTIEIHGLPLIELSFVKGGMATLGSEYIDADSNERQMHDVELSDFYLARYPVTQLLYESVMGSNPSKFVSSFRPVENVSWDDAVKFFGMLNKQYSAQIGSTLDSFFRLPSEHQWEYAARGGIFAPDRDSERYSGSDDIDEVAWHDDSGCRSSQRPGLKRPNQLGLYDMSGNINEWCDDEWDQLVYSELKRKMVTLEDKSHSMGWDGRVFRGGSWLQPRSSAGRPAATRRIPVILAAF